MNNSYTNFIHFLNYDITELTLFLLPVSPDDPPPSPAGELHQEGAIPHGTLIRNLVVVRHSCLQFGGERRLLVPLLPQFLPPSSLPLPFPLWSQLLPCLPHPLLLRGSDVFLSGPVLFVPSRLLSLECSHRPLLLGFSGLLLLRFRFSLLSLVFGRLKIANKREEWPIKKYNYEKY